CHLLSFPTRRSSDLGEHALIPRRLPHQFYVSFANPGNCEQLVLNIFLEKLSHAAALRRESETNRGLISSCGKRRDNTMIDQAQIDDIDRDFGIETRSQLMPNLLLDLFRAVGSRRVFRLELRN